MILHGISTDLNLLTQDLFQCPAEKLLASAVIFKPGYQFVLDDTITKTKNNFMFVSNEEKGTNTYPFYVPGDWNVSSIIKTQ
jgi:hypothetical protein